LNEAGFFVVKLLQRFKAFRFEPKFQPAGSLPPKEWLGKPGRQRVEKIFPAVNMTLHSKVCPFFHVLDYSERNLRAAFGSMAFSMGNWTITS
jgi:hypothetical protein